MFPFQSVCVCVCVKVYVFDMKCVFLGMNPYHYSSQGGKVQIFDQPIAKILPKFAPNLSCQFAKDIFSSISFLPKKSYENIFFKEMERTI